MLTSPNPRGDSRDNGHREQDQRRCGLQSETFGQQGVGFYRDGSLECYLVEILNCVFYSAMQSNRKPSENFVNDWCPNGSGGSTLALPRDANYLPQHPAKRTQECPQTRQCCPLAIQSLSDRSTGPVSPARSESSVPGFHGIRRLL